MVVTSHYHIDDSHPAGLWLEEAAAPYLEFRAHGFEVAPASLQGGQAPIDPRSEPTKTQAARWGEVVAALQTAPAMVSLD
jgi:putative intracellular protease/amidase